MLTEEMTQVQLFLKSRQFDCGDAAVLHRQIYLELNSYFYTHLSVNQEVGNRRFADFFIAGHISDAGGLAVLLRAKGETPLIFKEMTELARFDMVEELILLTVENAVWLPDAICKKPCLSIHLGAKTEKR